MSNLPSLMSQINVPYVYVNIQVHVKTTRASNFARGKRLKRQRCRGNGSEVKTLYCDRRL